ncbi:MAG: hypothetical protein BRD55_01715 [Bacteroidetes bacterium SW_9_63_38]|nr:MAG: hypothetical protein BRD55_01715 [Bacteroidetes bacterium SW_9_63_38]
MLSDLSDEARQYAEQEAWGQYRNVRYDTAEYVRQNGQWKRAGLLYMEVLIFDLQGVTSMPGINGFHVTHQSSSPAVVREIARLSLKADLEEGEMKVLYDRVADQTWMEAFPRSKDDIWAEASDEVATQRDILLLDRKVESLGSDQLLSAAEAEAYIKHKSEYEIIRRVERLLEVERAACIPPEKRDRVERYLASLDPEALANRWKAKVYRRGGEVMLSKNGYRKALEYFECALEAVDRDEFVEVERLVEQLRERLNR